MHRIALQKPSFTGPAALRRISLTFRSIVPGFEDAMANRVHDHAGLVQGQGGAPGSAAGP